jgi:hypothetical protein
VLPTVMLAVVELLPGISVNSSLPHSLARNGTARPASARTTAT